MFNYATWFDSRVDEVLLVRKVSWAMKSWKRGYWKVQMKEEEEEEEVVEEEEEEE